MQPTRDFREVLSYRELIFALGMREVRVRFKHTLLGVAWAVIMPLSLMALFTFVFQRVARVETGGIPYPVFVYIGLVPWQLHATILNQSARSLVDNRNLVTKVYFAREVLPLATVLSALVDFCIASLLVVVLMAVHGVSPGPGIFLLPLVVAVQLALGIACALILSGLNLLYRDVQYVLQVLVMLWMFASSVVYPIPTTGLASWLTWLNPMTPILDAYRTLILSSTIRLDPALAVAAAISLVLLFFGWRWFRRVERRFGELA
ncbi:MAG: ABC transporter permease [Planctomycetes bacterium]|nr:ABC transporter permease [Planctomycetota bacterium]